MRSLTCRHWIDRGRIITGEWRTIWPRNHISEFAFRILSRHFRTELVRSVPEYITSREFFCRIAIIKGMGLIGEKPFVRRRSPRHRQIRRSFFIHLFKGQTIDVTDQFLKVILHSFRDAVYGRNWRGRAMLMTVAIIPFDRGSIRTGRYQREEIFGQEAVPRGGRVIIGRKRH